MKKWIGRIISLIIIIGTFILISSVYNKYYFNDFIKAHEKNTATSFYRDAENSYKGEKSYCIENTDFNDSLFFKEIKVEKNIPYKITCMVKTENVESDMPETAGACISIMGTAKQSLPIQGTNDWQQVTLFVDSEDSEILDISFRLGGYQGYSKGKAWFADIHVERGAKDTTTEWNTVCFLMDNIDVTLEDGKRYNYSLTEEDKELLRDNASRFTNSCRELSEGKMTATYEIIEIKEPITTLSYDDENYYYVAPTDVEKLIDPYLKQNEYDHIFIGIRMGDVNSAIPVNEWIGLGSMRYGNLGFSDIRMPNDLNHSTMYKYDIQNDTFPEEVFIHEFLHSLERNLNEKKYTFPALHDNEKFGYQTQQATGLKRWYSDYMKCEIYSDTGRTGLDEIVYSTKPVQESDFEHSIEIKFVNEPSNPIEALIQIVNNTKLMFNKDKKNQVQDVEYITITSD